MSEKLSEIVNGFVDEIRGIFVPPEPVESPETAPEGTEEPLGDDEGNTTTDSPEATEEALEAPEDDSSPEQDFKALTEALEARIDELEGKVAIPSVTDILEQEIDKTDPNLNVEQVKDLSDDDFEIWYERNILHNREVITE